MLLFKTCLLITCGKTYNTDNSIKTINLKILAPTSNDYLFHFTNKLKKPDNVRQSCEFFEICLQYTTASTETLIKKQLGRNFALDFTFQNSAPFKSSKKR